MKNKTIHNPQIPNPALKQFNKLIGEWKTVGMHPYLPGTTFHGHTSFEWIEGGAFMMMHSNIDEPEVPNAIAIFGSDDSTGEYFMLYFDERKVSRKYQVSLQDDMIKWWRDTPDFSQRFTLSFTDNDKTITSRGEMRKEGRNWEKDLELTYTRIK